MAKTSWTTCIPSFDFSPVSIREKDKDDFLVRGLKNEATRTSLLSHFKATDCTCYELIELAQDIDPRRQVKGEDRLRGQENTKKQDKPTDKGSVSFKSRQDYVSFCHKCQEKGHTSRDHATQGQQARGSKSSTFTKNYYDDKPKKQGCTADIKNTLISKHPSRPIIPVRVDGHKSVDALVDTGADIQIIRAREAEKMGL